MAGCFPARRHILINESDELFLDSTISNCVCSVIILISVTSTQKKLGYPILFLPRLFSSTFFSLHLGTTLLMIWSALLKSETVVSQINSMSTYSNRIGYICHLYRLIFLYFKIFAR
jgi:hypothetical protein